MNSGCVSTEEGTTKRLFHDDKLVSIDAGESRLPTTSPQRLLVYASEQMFRTPSSVVQTSDGGHALSGPRRSGSSSNASALPSAAQTNDGKHALLSGPRSSVSPAALATEFAPCSSRSASLCAVLLVAEVGEKNDVASGNRVGLDGARLAEGAIGGVV